MVKFIFILLSIAFLCGAVRSQTVPSYMQKLGEYSYRDNVVQKNVNKSYYLYNRNKGNANNAKANCYYLGAGWGLAEITTLGEQTYILNMVKNSPTIGLGWRLIVGPNIRNGVWMDRAMGQASPITYKIDWYPGEPNNADGIEKCMAIFKGSGKTAMMDMECGTERNQEHSFICTHALYY